MNNICISLDICWIELYSFCLCLSKLQIHFFAFPDHIHWTQVIHFLMMFSPSNTNALLFYNSLVTSRPSEVCKPLYSFLNGPRLLDLGFVTCLWPHYILLAPVWQFSRYDAISFPVNPHIQYGHSILLRV